MRSVAKRIWAGDIVKISGGKYNGYEGIVTKVKIGKVNGTHVHVRIKEVHKPSSNGARIHVRHIQILKYHRGNERFRIAENRKKATQKRNMKVKNVKVQKVKVRKVKVRKPKDDSSNTE